jgi:hypothetical protein
MMHMHHFGNKRLKRAGTTSIPLPKISLKLGGESPGPGLEASTGHKLLLLSYVFNRNLKFALTL